MNALRNALSVIRDFRRSYISLNLVYYGLILAGMLVALACPSLQESLLKAIGQAVRQGPLAPVAQAYREGHLLSAMTKTFLINFFAGSLLVISLPSLVIPFSGLVMGVVRAAMWGLIFSPIHAQLSPAKIAVGVLIAILLFLEGQGYVLAMQAAYIQSRLFLHPAEAGKTGLAQGYLAGVKRSLPVYLLVAIVLAVAAVYEATIGILLLPRLR